MDNDPDILTPPEMERRLSARKRLNDKPGCIISIVADAELEPGKVVLNICVRDVLDCELIVDRADYDPLRILAYHHNHGSKIQADLH